MGNNNYLMPWDITQSGTEGNEDVPVSAGTASKLIFRLGGTLSGSQTATLTLRKNGVDTAITCTIPNNGSSCTDFTHTATFADGDTFSIRYNESGSPNTRVKYAFQYATQ
jgi:hypothetical protein